MHRSTTLLQKNDFYVSAYSQKVNIFMGWLCHSASIVWVKLSKNITALCKFEFLWVLKWAKPNCLKPNII